MSAVLPELDRRNMRSETPPPAVDAPEQKQERGELWVRAASLRFELGDRQRAEMLVERTLREAGGTSAAADALALRESWRGR